MNGILILLLPLRTPEDFLKSVKERLPEYYRLGEVYIAVRIIKQSPLPVIRQIISWIEWWWDLPVIVKAQKELVGIEYMDKLEELYNELHEIAKKLNPEKIVEGELFA